jgi:hypothetical protein
MEDIVVPTPREPESFQYINISKRKRNEVLHEKGMMEENRQ